MAATRSPHLQWLLRAFIALALIALPAHASDFDAANRAYESGDFEAARKGYESLIERGGGTANVFYNLGNADFRVGDLGGAVLAYERALALEPAHPEARRNLEVARERAGAKVPVIPWYGRAFPAWHGDTFALVAAAAAWLAVLAFVFSRVHRARRGTFGVLAFISLLVALYGVAGLWYTEQDRSLAIITRKEAVARLGPAEQSGVAGTLPAGSRVQVVSERGEWIYCRLPGDALGWLPAADLQRVRLQT